MLFFFDCNSIFNLFAQAALDFSQPLDRHSSGAEFLMLDFGFGIY